MAAVNSIISQSDYNTIRNKLVNVMGSGSIDYGWGQTSRLKSSSIAEGNSVTINEWANLRYDIINAYTHINGSTPTTAQVAEGNTIRYTNTFTPDSGTLDVPQYQYNAWVDSIIANRFTVAAGQSATSSPSLPSTYTTAWSTSKQCTISFFWSTAAQARYFFNSGGLIRVTASFARRSGVNTAQNIAWESLLSTAGTQSFGANTPGTGLSPATGVNWYRTTSTFQQIYSTASSSPYGSNNYKIYSRCTDVASNASGTSASGELRLIFTDGYVDPGNYGTDVPNTDDVVDGTLTVSASILYATGVMVPTGTGNFTVTNPTIAISAIT